jgi:hypothetical protein
MTLFVCVGSSMRQTRSQVAWPCRPARWPDRYHLGAGTSGSRRSCCPIPGRCGVQRLYPKTVPKPAVRTMLIPVPRIAAVGGQPLRDIELLAWCGEVVRSVLADLPVP